MARTGRRPGAGGTRDKILAAARTQFGKHGYEGATIRGIASAARVDPKLVLHYFDSKDGVFEAALELPFDPAEALELDHPRLRASLAASQLIGVAMLRYVVKVEPLASAPAADVAAWVGPSLQRYFTDPTATRSNGKAVA